MPTGAGVELLQDEGERNADLAVVLGGDGTMLRALTRFLDTGVPVIGANFGRVGLPDRDPGRASSRRGWRASSPGSTTSCPLPTLEIEVGGGRYAAVNDAVVVSGAPGRIVEIQYLLDGEDLGTQPCDGLLCATPPGSTAYNLSNGGPVLVWGLEAAVLTFVAPHTLHARPLVVGPGFNLEVVNRSPDVEAVVLADGHRGRARSRRGSRSPCGSGRAGRCSPRCPSRRSSAATPRSSGSTDKAGPVTASAGLWTRFPEVVTPLSRLLT